MDKKTQDRQVQIEDGAEKSGLLALRLMQGVCRIVCL
jgi:hypothetical protein